MFHRTFHPRLVLLVPLVLTLAADGVPASEPVAGPIPAIAVVEGGDFDVMPVGARRRRDEAETNASASMLTMRGTWDCPGGYEAVFQGYIYAFRQKGVDVPLFGGVEPSCWPIQGQQPMETTFLGSWERVGMCVVCVRDLDVPLSGLPPITTTPVPGGGDADVPDRNTLTPDDDPDEPESSTSPIPGEPRI